MLARVHSVETFGGVDGPGIRYVLFLKGCRLRCKFCHNPDTWKMDSSDLRSADDVLAQARRYRAYWGSEGGITVSGGEPLLQMDFLLDYFDITDTINVYTFFELMATEIVSDISEAEVVVTNKNVECGENVQVIREYDIDKMIQLMNV